MYGRHATCAAGMKELNDCERPTTLAPTQHRPLPGATHSSAHYSHSLRLLDERVTRVLMRFTLRLMSNELPSV